MYGKISWITKILKRGEDDLIYIAPFAISLQWRQCVLSDSLTYFNTVLSLQLPIPVLIGSLSFKLRLRGWRPGHHQLARTESDHSLSTTNKEGHQATNDTSTPAGKHHQQPSQLASGSEYGSVGKEWAHSATGRCMELVAEHWNYRNRLQIT